MFGIHVHKIILNLLDASYHLILLCKPVGCIVYYMYYDCLLLYCFIIFTCLQSQQERRIINEVKYGEGVKLCYIFRIRNSFSL